MSRRLHARRSGATLALCSLAVGLFTAAPAATAQAGTQVTLLNINDFHGHLENAVALAGTVETLKSQYPGAAFTSAGDNLGGSPFASAFKQDQPTIDVLNAMGLKASAVGNHEFDKGVTDLTGRIIPASKWSYLGANVTVNGAPMKSREILTINGKRVAIVGAVTRETASLVSPAAIQGVVFSDPVAAVNRVAAELRDGNEANGEADVVVAEYHDGAAVSSTLQAGLTTTSSFADIATKTSDHVDAIFNGHTHQTYAWTGQKPDGTPRPIVQAASYGTLLGRITLTLGANGKVTAEGAVHQPVATPDLKNPVVADVKRIVDATAAEAKVVGDQPVGTLRGDITTAFKDGKRDDRMSESTLSNLTAQFMVEAMADRGGADLAFMNPGGVRAELLNDPAGVDGNITKAEANSVLPFANTLMSMSMTGAQIKTVLEQQWQPAGASRPFLALGASKELTWTFDPTRPAGDRITSISLAGKPVDPAKSYTVASQSFLAAGGDNFVEFAKASNPKDTGVIDSEAWQAFLSKYRAKGLAPDSGRHAVAAKGLPTTVEPGVLYRFTLSDLDLTSLGVPAARSAVVTFDGSQPRTFDVVTGPDTATFGAGAFPSVLDGRVEIATVIPSDAARGPHIITVKTDTGTVVTIPVTVGPATGPSNVSSGLSSMLNLGSLGGLGSLGN